MNLTNQMNQINQMNKTNQINQPVALQATAKSIQCTHASIGLSLRSVDPHLRLDHIRL